MANDNISNEIILTGRIYPAIQSCVNNRYKIILAFFAYHSFIYSSDNCCEIANKTGVKWGASILFGVFIILNTANYLLNTCDQIKRETGKKWSWKSLWKAADIEFYFLGLSIIMIILVHWLVSYPTCC